MLDETNLIPSCNDGDTRLCHDLTWGTYWVYAPTCGRIFPTARTPEGAWQNWYVVLAHMTPDKKLQDIFNAAARSIKAAIPMDMLMKAIEPDKEVVS